uniref:DUF3591 domain-containing protein n=1 Tax=Caenorhabditis tropicalis TaxID=1561998 RepID=A0A1I7TLE6_9PELO
MLLNIDSCNTDFTGEDKMLVMGEYCEEHPVILSQPGIASKIKNFFMRRQGINWGEKQRSPIFRFSDSCYRANRFRTLETVCPEHRSTLSTMMAAEQK